MLDGKRKRRREEYGVCSDVLRLTGAALILCAGVLARNGLLASSRGRRAALRELADALERMAQEIRLCLTPIPKLLDRAYGGAAGGFLTRVEEGLLGGETLEQSWRGAAQALPVNEEECAMIAALGARLGGDAESVCAALRLTAAQLREHYESERLHCREQERLTTAACLSASLLLLIVLF